MQDYRALSPNSASLGVVKRGCGHPSGAVLHAAVMTRSATQMRLGGDSEPLTTCLAAAS
jgi:hypothetical protein